MYVQVPLLLLAAPYLRGRGSLRGEHFCAEDIWKCENRLDYRHYCHRGDGGDGNGYLGGGPLARQTIIVCNLEWRGSASMQW